MTFMQDVVERAIIGNTMRELQDEGYEHMSLEDREHFLIVKASRGRRNVWIKLNFQNDGAAAYSDWNATRTEDNAMMERMQMFAERLSGV